MAETGSQGITKIKRTLGLAGITIHAMTLIAPGAFVWFLFPLQLAATAGGKDIWPGVLVALLAAFLSAVAFSGLAQRYPESGNYSAYHFAQRVFNDMTQEGRKNLARPAKFVTGWAAHLFYWVYPGVMIALLTSLIHYLLRQFGYQPTWFGLILLAASLAGFIGFLALRGITGSMTSSILLNVMQIVVLLVLSVLAIALRLVNPLHSDASTWLFQSPAQILIPASLESLLVQASVSIFLVVGFEAVVSLGVAAANPRRDIPRGTILALLIQGLFAYSLQYFAYSFASGSAALAQSANGLASPIGNLAITIGDQLLWNNGYTLMVVAAATVFIAGLAAGLTSMNSGVRTTFAMTLDPEVPEVLSLFNESFATPTNAVIILTLVSAVIGSVGAIGGISLLLGFVLSANLGAFLLYALICCLSLLRDPAARGGRLLSLLGLTANLGLAGVIIWSAFGSNPVSASARVAIWMALAWLAVSLIYLAVTAARKTRKMTMS
jgi:basic amino acid/polyamine antiporter, APA family